jgi:hypothetical protein
LLSEIEFGAFLAYSPKGQSDASVRSRSIVRDGVKYDTPHVIRRIAERLQQDLRRSGLEEHFRDDVVLVPVPRRAPLKYKAARWPARRICEELVKTGLGREVLPCLERSRAVPKSAYARPGERPDPEIHYESMRISATAFRPEKITVVDDFVTRGATLLAAVSRVQQRPSRRPR